MSTSSRKNRLVPPEPQQPVQTPVAAAEGQAAATGVVWVNGVPTVPGFTAYNTTGGRAYRSTALPAGEKPAFVDMGGTISVYSQSDDALLAAMALAVTRWGAVGFEGEPGFVERCKALARQNHIPTQAAAPAPGAPATPVATEVAADASSRPVPALPVSEPIDTERSAERSRTYFHDLLIDAGYGTASLGLQWTGQSSASIGPDYLRGPPVRQLVELAARAGVAQLESPQTGQAINVREARMCQSVWEHLAHRIGRSERDTVAAGTACARYLDALGVEWNQDARWVLGAPGTEVLQTDPETRQTFLRALTIAAEGDEHKQAFAEAVAHDLAAQDAEPTPDRRQGGCWRSQPYN